MCVDVRSVVSGIFLRRFSVCANSIVYKAKSAWRDDPVWTILGSWSTCIHAFGRKIAGDLVRLIPSAST